MPVLSPSRPQRLADLVSQRKIGRTYGSVSSRLPLQTPSGSQYTESQLETDLVLQLAFSLRVTDIVTQPIIYYSKGGQDRHYTPDVLVETLPEPDGVPRLYLIEVKPKDHLKAFLAESTDKIEAAHLWCAGHGAAFKALTEKEIRTPYLGNAMLLGRFLGQSPEPKVMALLGEICRSNPTLGHAVTLAMAAGIPEYVARQSLEQAIANRLIGCDLTQAVTDSSQLFAQRIKPDRNGHDPLLKILDKIKLVKNKS